MGERFSVKTKQPFVFSNLAVSLDGKIATTSREFFAIGSPRDLRLLRKLRDEADVILFGAEVLRTFRKACLPLARGRRITNAVLSRTLSGIEPEWPFFNDERIDRILYVTGKVPERRLRQFQKKAIVVNIDASRPALAILRDLARRKVGRVGVEGGGGIMWEFVKSNLIDEYFVTIVPRILGGVNAPTLVDGKGFTPLEALNLELYRSRRVGSELFLIYRPVPSRGKIHPLLR